MLSKTRKNIFKPINAFTLIEMLISIAIFIIITTIFIVDFKYHVSKDALNQAIEQVIIYYRQAQTATLVGVKIGVVSPNYGLYLTTDSAGNKNKQIIVFADLNRDKLYNTGEEVSTNCSNCGVFSLPNGIQINGLSPPIAATSLAITFFATSSNEIYFNGAKAVVGGSITLANTQTGGTASLTVNYSTGQISR